MEFNKMEMEMEKCLIKSIEDAERALVLIRKYPKVFCQYHNSGINNLDFIYQEFTLAVHYRHTISITIDHVFNTGRVSICFGMKPVSFEVFLELIPSDIRKDFIFNLDLFV